MVHLRFNQVFMCINSLFLFYWWVVFCDTDESQFVHPFLTLKDIGMSSFPFHPPSIQPLCILLGRGPQPMDHRPVPVQGLLETGLYSRWAVGKQVKLHWPLPITPHCSHNCMNHLPPPPSLWKNCLPRNYLGSRKVGDHCYKAWLNCSSYQLFPLPSIRPLLHCVAVRCIDFDEE